jgi:hypothetical protein
MFRSIHVRFIALGVLYSFKGLAQPVIPERNQLPSVQYHNALPVDIAPDSGAGQPPLIARSQFSYDGHRFMLTDSVRYIYPSMMSQGQDGMPLPAAQITRRTPLAGAGSRDRRSLRTFDAHNRLISFVQQRWDTLHSSWADQCRQAFSYRNGILTSDTAWNMSDRTGSWVPAGFSEYERDKTGGISRIRSWIWNEPGRLQLVADLEYHFDETGKLRECVSRSGSGSGVSRRLVAYPAAGSANGLFYESWDTVTNGWKKSYGYAFVSGDRNRRSAQLNLQWNTARAGWDTLSGYSYDYGAEGRLQSMTYWTGVPRKPFSAVVDRYEYAYNSNGQRISAVRRSGADSAAGNSGFETGAEKILFYYKPLAAANARSEAMGATFRVWPVPARKQLHFDLGLLRGKAYKILVTDLQGRSLSSANRKAGDAGIDQIDLSGMPAGSYNIQIESETGSLQTARFVVIE